MRDVLREVPFFYERVAPHGLQQFLFADQTVGVLNQKQQDVERFRSQSNGRIRARQRAPAWIEHKLSETVQVAHRSLVSLQGSRRGESYCPNCRQAQSATDPPAFRPRNKSQAFPMEALPVCAIHFRSWAYSALACR